MTVSDRISEPPSYEEAVSEAHRPGHEWIWESTDSGRHCVICGHCELRDAA